MAAALLCLALTPVTPMTTARSGHTATRLRDGRVLIAGGMVRNRAFLNTAELYDPATRRFTPAGRMASARVGHAAALLPDGRVLLAGGWDTYLSTTASAEVYDPRTNRFTALPNGMSARRARASLTKLKDGRLLLAGGAEGDHAPLRLVELFDPKTMTFRVTGALSGARMAHTATLLRDGRVLVAGGRDDHDRVLASVEMYDPKRGVFVAAGSLGTARYKHTAALLPDGRVLVAGGSDARDWSGQFASAEIYDPAANRFTAAPPMLAARFKLPDDAIVLPNGVLIAGGADFAEVFANGRFTRVPGSLGGPWHYMSATSLANGDVLLAGGYANTSEATPQAWVATALSGTSDRARR